MPYWKKICSWGKSGKRAILGRRIICLNRKGTKFDGENDDWTDLKAADKQPKLIHSDIMSEILGIETEDIYDGIIGPIPIREEEKRSSYAEHAAKAGKKCRLIYY